MRVEKVSVETRAANVIGILPGTDPALASEAVVVGAHYDHLGGADGVVYPGADDNGSGTAVVLGLARAFAAAGGTGRTLVFAFFGAEELGLIGSRHYVNRPAVPLDRTVGMVNFDMLLIALGLAVSMTGWVVAQQPTAPAQPGASAPQESDQEDLTSDIALTRASIQLRRQAIVTSVMDLTPTESQAFWPMYRDYRIEMAKVGDRVSKLLVDYSAQYDTLTDDQAKKIMKDWLSIEKAKMDVKGKYISRFQKILPARKVMRFFQADNKLDAVLNAQLASIVPLAR